VSAHRPAALVVDHGVGMGGTSPASTFSEIHAMISVSAHSRAFLARKRAQPAIIETIA
jgi:hypothetical protein